MSSKNLQQELVEGTCLRGLYFPCLFIQLIIPIHYLVDEVAIGLRNSEHNRDVPLQCAWVIKAPPGHQVLFFIERLVFSVS